MKHTPALALTLCLFACEAVEDGTDIDADADDRELDETEPVDDLAARPPIEIDGRIFVRFDFERDLLTGPLAHYATVDENGERILDLPPPADLPLEELAHALRPVTIHRGETVIAAEPSYEAARLVLAGTPPNVSVPGYDPSGGDGRIPSGTGCCGAEDRVPIRANTTWPWATVMASMVPANQASSDWGTNTQARECTWQLVGASTALAAAHCFWYTMPEVENWIQVAKLRWGASPDGQDNTQQPIPAGYPWGQESLGGMTFLDSDPTYGEAWGDGGVTSFRPYVTAAWIAGPDGVVEWDFAVVDFRSGSIPKPGNIAGWMGWGMYSDQQILNNTYIHAGVPKLKIDDTPVSSTQWPQIWATFNKSIVTVGPYWVDYDGDCSGGDSGSAIWQYLDNGWRVTGITHGQGGTARNQPVCVARRFDNTYYAFMRDTSEY